MPNGGSVHPPEPRVWDGKYIGDALFILKPEPDPRTSVANSGRRTIHEVPGSVDSHAPVLDDDVVPAGGHQNGEPADGGPAAGESNNLPPWPTGYGEPLCKRRRMEEPPQQNPQPTDYDVPAEAAVPTDQDVPQLIDGEYRN